MHPTLSAECAKASIPLAALRDNRVEALGAHRHIITDVLSDWTGCGHLTRVEARKVERDPRALRLAAFVAGIDAEEWTLDAARRDQARCLIRARACQLTGRFDLARTVLKRASVYAKTRKPMRRALAAVSHHGLTAGEVVGAVNLRDAVAA